MAESGESNLEFRVSVGGINQLGQLQSQIARVTKNTVSMRDASMSLSAAFPKLEGAAKDLQKIYYGQATSLKQLVRNQKIFRNTVKAQVGLLKESRKETTRGTAAWTSYSKQIRRARKDMRGLPLRKLGTDLKSVSNKLLAVGKNTQWTGRQMMVGITAPLGMVLRSAMRAFESFEQQFVRTVKILGLFGKEGSKASAAADALRVAIRDVSTEVGASQSIVAALTSDFAQMGKALLMSAEEINYGKESMQGVAVEYSKLALQLEKVGQVQAGVGRDFVANLAGLVKLLDPFGNRIDKVRGLLAKFNMVENTTALSMADLAEAFPQVSPAAAAAGVQLTFLTGLLGRMKEMGLNATESAHALKFAFQRMVNPTQKVIALAERLGNSIGAEFHKDLGVGNEMLFNLAENIKLISKEASDEDALVYLGELVGKRQASRLYALVAGMDGLSESIVKISQSFSTLHVTTRGVFSTMLEDLSSASGLDDVKDAISNAFRSEESIAEFERDVINSGAGMKAGLEATSTSAAVMTVALQNLSPELKSLVIDYMGATAAGKVFQTEFEAVMSGPAAQMDVLRTKLRNLMQEIGAVFFDTIQGLIPHVEDFIVSLTNMSAGSKKALIIFMAFVGVIGPVVFVVAQLANTFALFGKASASVIPKMKSVTRSMLLSKRLAGENMPMLKGFGTGFVIVGKKAKTSGMAIKAWARSSTKALLAYKAVAADPGINATLFGAGVTSPRVKSMGSKAAAKAVPPIPGLKPMSPLVGSNAGPSVRSTPVGLPTRKVKKPIGGLARIIPGFGKIADSVSKSSKQVDSFIAKMSTTWMTAMKGMRSSSSKMGRGVRRVYRLITTDSQRAAIRQFIIAQKNALQQTGLYKFITSQHKKEELKKIIAKTAGAIKSASITAIETSAVKIEAAKRLSIRKAQAAKAYSINMMEVASVKIASAKVVVLEKIAALKREALKKAVFVKSAVFSALEVVAEKAKAAKVFAINRVEAIKKQAIKGVTYAQTLTWHVLEVIAERAKEAKIFAIKKANVVKMKMLSLALAAHLNAQTAIPLARAKMVATKLFAIEQAQMLKKKALHAAGVAQHLVSIAIPTARTKIEAAKRLAIVQLHVLKENAIHAIAAVKYAASYAAWAVVVHTNLKVAAAKRFAIEKANAAKMKVLSFTTAAYMNTQVLKHKAIANAAAAQRFAVEKVNLMKIKALKAVAFGQDMARHLLEVTITRSVAAKEYAIKQAFALKVKALGAAAYARKLAWYVAGLAMVAPAEAKEFSIRMAFSMKKRALDAADNAKKLAWYLLGTSMVKAEESKKFAIRQVAAAKTLALRASVFAQTMVWHLLELASAQAKAAQKFVIDQWSALQTTALYRFITAENKAEIVKRFVVAKANAVKTAALEIFKSAVHRMEAAKMLAVERAAAAQAAVAAATKAAAQRAAAAARVAQERAAAAQIAATEAAAAARQKSLLMERLAREKAVAIKRVLLERGVAVKSMAISAGSSLFNMGRSMFAALFSKKVWMNSLRMTAVVGRLSFKAMWIAIKTQAIMTAAVFRVAFTGAIKAIKVSMMTTGILALFLLVAGVVLFIKGNLGRFGEAMAPGIALIKNAFGTLIATLKLIGSIVFSVFGEIFGGGDSAGGPADGIAKVGDAFTKVAGIIQMFSNILNKVVAKYLPKILKVAMGAFKTFVDAISSGIGWMIKNWRSIAETVIKFLHVFQTIQEKIIDAALSMVRIVSKILRKLVAVFFAVVQPLAMAVGKILEALGFLYGGVTNVVQFIVDKFFWLLETLRPIINGIGGVIGGLVNLLPGTKVDWGNFLPSTEALDSLRGTIVDGVGAVGDVISRAVTWIGKELPGAMQRAGGVLDAVLSGVDSVLEDIINVEAADAVNGFLTGILDRDFDFGGPGNGIASAVEEAVTDAEFDTDDMDQSGLTEAVASATGKGFQSAVNDFIGKVKAALADELKSIIDSALSAFDAYAEVQLSAYDARVDAINAVKEAEAELTKTLKYEADRRALINKMALDKENFIRNRSLAIYEGRVEDARSLSVKFGLGKDSSSDQLDNLDNKREDYLVNKERDAAIESIKIAKAAEKERLEIIRAGLEEQLRLAQEKLPATFEEFQAWMDSVNDLVDVGFQEAFGDSGVLDSSLEGVGQTIKDAINGWDDILADFDPVVKFQDIFDKVNEKWKSALQWDIIAQSWMDDYMDAAIPVLQAALAEARGEVEEAAGSGVAGMTDKETSAIIDGIDKVLGRWKESTGNTADAVLLTFAQKWKEAQGESWFSSFNSAAMDADADKNLTNPNKHFNGGKISAQYGRYLGGFKSAAVPVVAHGGEFIMSAKAVQNVGLSNLEAMNNSRNYEGGGGSNGVNIYVDNFVGQPEWFEGMMSEYNVSVAPKNERSRGIESRKISSMSDNNRRGRV